MWQYIIELPATTIAICIHIYIVLIFIHREEESVKEKVDQLNYSFKDEDSLMKKLRTAARKFAIDSSSYIEAIQQIKGTALPPVAFREVYGRIFLTRLTYPEMGALLSIIDESGLGLVDGDTFVKMFYKLGEYLSFRPVFFAWLKCTIFMLQFLFYTQVDLRKKICLRMCPTRSLRSTSRLCAPARRLWSSRPSIVQQYLPPAQLGPRK